MASGIVKCPDGERVVAAACHRRSRISWSALSARTPNIKCPIALTPPFTRRWLPPNSSLRRALLRSAKSFARPHQMLANRKSSRQQDARSLSTELCRPISNGNEFNPTLHLNVYFSPPHGKPRATCRVHLITLAMLNARKAAWCKPKLHIEKVWRYVANRWSGWANKPLIHTCKTVNHVRQQAPEKAHSTITLLEH